MRGSVLSVLFLACLPLGGCRGSGGGTSPTAPPTTPPAAPALAVVEGSLVGLFGPRVDLPQFSEDFSGSTVRVERVDDIGALDPPPTGVVGPDNTFRVEDVPVGNAWVTVDGPNHLTREMRWAIRAGTNTFEGIDLVNDPDFDGDAFDRMFRWSTSSHTLRWTSFPHIVVISPNIDYDEVVTAMVEITDMTEGRWSASAEARPPTASERASLDVYCRDAGPDMAGKIFVGQGMIDQARICLAEDAPDRQPEVEWVLIRVENDPQSIRHGLGHAAGAWHPCSHSQPNVDSVMSICRDSTVPPPPLWTDFDRQAFLFTYARPPGTRPDDFSRHLEIMYGVVSEGDSATGSSSGPILEAGDSLGVPDPATPPPGP